VVRVRRQVVKKRSGSGEEGCVETRGAGEEWGWRRGVAGEEGGRRWGWVGERGLSAAPAGPAGHGTWTDATAVGQVGGPGMLRGKLRP
jgi:hypothetical protein